MIGLTRFSLKRPVTLILAVITVLFFGLRSVMNAPMELNPEMSLPMMVVSTIYPGASPADIDELISKKIESEVSTLTGIKTVSVSSMENASTMLLQYEFGTNMDKAYINLKKVLDSVKSSLPKDAHEPNIIEIDMNAQSDIQLSIAGGTDGNLQDYVNTNIVPEFKKMSSVGSVSISGGQSSYIRIELIPEKLAQYNLAMSDIGNIISSADFSTPVGKVDYGRQSLSVSIGANYKDINRLKNIVIPLKTGDVIHLSDVANVYDALEEKNSLSRYNGEEVVSVAITKQQSSTSVEVSKQVNKVIEELKANNKDLTITTIFDSSKYIKESISDVFKTLIMAVILSMIVLFIFFGDIKASLIVGSSIPISVMVALTLMRAAGFSLNLISMGSLVLGIGMIVDASIVVLESCFRSKSDKNFFDAAVEGTGIVINSITGSIITTCVVFLPLAMLKGLSGQLFAQLGYTIVFCMVSSLFSAIMIVPLLYLFFHPVEKTDTLANRVLLKVQDGYRNTVKKIIPKKITVVGISVILLVISFILAGNVGMVLMPESDDGQIAISISVAPGLNIKDVDRIAKQIEDFVAADPDVENYQMTFGNSEMFSEKTGISITAYLKKKRSRKTKNVIQEWQPVLTKIPDTSISVKNQSNSSSGVSNRAVEINLQSTDYNLVRKTTNEIVDKMHSLNYLLNVHSSAENAAPIVKINVDPVQAEAIGMTPGSVAGIVYQNLTDTEVMKYSSGDSTITVKMNYPDESYDTINEIENILITGVTGTKTPLSDLATVSFEDSAVTITRSDKKYQVSITADKVAGYKGDANSETDAFVDSVGLPNGVERATNAYNDMMSDEMTSLLNALLTAIFLIFIVMAMQFESPRFSLMVMFTIPFSLIGAFGLLWLFDVPISMMSMIGFLMMVGTVVNNGILYVDTVNQYKVEMPLDDALVEAGATRIRPILLTTLTTIISMLPMALGYGTDMLQGLALVNVGGLIASTLLALLLLPTLYKMLDKAGKKLTGNHLEAGLDID